MKAFRIQKQYRRLRRPFEVRSVLVYHEYKSCIRACFPMSFSLVLMGSSHRLLSVTSPRSHPLLPPPRRSPCATLTVTRFLASVAGTTAHTSPHQIPPPISNGVFLYSLYISALVVFFNDSVCVLCPCLISYHEVYLIGQLTPASRHESPCAVGRVLSESFCVGTSSVFEISH